MQEDNKNAKHTGQISQADVLHSATAFAIHQMNLYPDLTEHEALENAVQTATALVALVNASEKSSPVSGTQDRAASRAVVNESAEDGLGVFENEPEPDDRIIWPK